MSAVTECLGLYIFVGPSDRRIVIAKRVSVQYGCEGP